MTKFDIIIIGHIGYDYKVFSNGSTRMDIGGSGLYVSISASLFSSKVGLISKIGKDFEKGAFHSLPKSLDIEGISLSSGRSSRFFNRYDENYIESEFKANLGVGKEINIKDLPFNHLDASIYHIATMPPTQQLSIMEELPERGYVIHKMLRIQSLGRTSKGMIIRRSQDAGYRDDDILLAVAGTPVETFKDLQRMAAKWEPGDKIELTLVRNQEQIKMEMTLGGQGQEVPLEREVKVTIVKRSQLNRSQKAILSGMIGQR